MKTKLIAKQFDKEALYLWIQDNLKDMRRFAHLQEAVLFKYFGPNAYYRYSFDKGFDPAVWIYFGDKQKIREAIQDLRDYPKAVKEFETLRRKVIQAFKELNVPKDFKVRYNSDTKQEDSYYDADIVFDYEKIIAKYTRQRIKDKLAYAKFAIKVLSALLKIKGSKYKLAEEDDIVYEYDVYGNLIYKGMYDYSNWSQLKQDKAFEYGRGDYITKPKYNEELGIYLIGVSTSYQSKRNIQDARSSKYIFSEIYNLVGFAVVRNEFFL